MTGLNNMEFLKEILGDQLYNQVFEKITAYNNDEANKGNQIKLGNLSGGGYISKSKYTDLEATKTTTEARLLEAQQMIEQLRFGSLAENQTAESLKEYESQVAQLQEENRRLKFDYAMQWALIHAGVKDLDYITYQIKTAHPDLAIDDSGHIKGIEDILKRMHTRYPDAFIEQAPPARRVAQVNYLPNGNHDVLTTQDQYNKMGYHERLRLKKENPTRYRQLSRNTRK